MKRFFRLLSLSSPYRRYFIISCVFMVIYTVLNGISISAVPVLVDRILAGRETELPDSMQSLIPFRGQLEDVLAYVNSIDKVKLLMWIGIMVLVIFVLKGVSLYLSQVTMEIMGQRVTRDIRSNLYNKYYRLPMNYFVRSRIGELMTRITSDVNLINEVFSGRFVTNIKDTLQAVPFLAWMFILDWKLSLMLIVVVPLFVFPVAAIGRKIRKLSRKTLEKIADISSVINETISGIRIVKIFCMEDYEQKRFYNQLDKYKKIRIDVIKKEALYNPLTEIIGGVVVMFVLIIFPRKVMSGEITQGFLIAYLICLAAMIKPLRTIGKINFALQNAMAALQRIFDLLGAPEGTSDAGGAKIFPGIQESVMFQNVSFGYASDEPVLKGVDFEAGINKITAIVGPSGCGKTTLVNLIPRFFDPWKGVIFMDGTDIREFSIASLREKIAMVTQETFLFNDTVAGNIAYGHEDISLNDVQEAAKNAHAHEFILSLPKGYETVIGERGARLSGGQKQRIAIARALLKNPPLLILDEATSALDVESERIVQDAINRLMEKRTVIVIAHRLSTIMKADRIYVMDEGRITASGKHDDLLKESDLYKKLYEMQFI